MNRKRTMNARRRWIRRKITQVGKVSEHERFIHVGKVNRRRENRNAGRQIDQVN